MSRCSRIRDSVRAAIVALGLLSAGGALAQPVAPDWAAAWADRVVGDGVAKGRASAAVVSVVQDGRVILSKGYGVADHPGGRAVDPARDQFQVASVSKTFTAALLAQLVESGVVGSLDDPVSRYLKRAPLPTYHGKAITLRELLTHSAGFEERGFGYFAQGLTTTPASGDYIRRALPALVREPGARIVYANIDPPLVGAAIEDVTGQTLHELMAKRLFQPLGMQHSVLNYTPGGGPDLVKAYAHGRLIPADINAPFFAATGGVQTTGQDMAAYMNALLGQRPDVFPPAVIGRLTTPLARNDAALDPLGMYWFLTRWGPVHVVEHAGGLNGAAAWVILVPERRLGVFIAWAGGAPPLGYDKLHDSFLDAALGPPSPPVAMANPGDLQRYAGRYFTERRPHSSPEVVFWLQDATQVSVKGDGLMIGRRGPYLETSPGVFVRSTPKGQQGDVVVFKGDQLLERVGYSKRVGGWSDPANQFRTAVLGWCLVVSGILAGFWPKGWSKWPAIVAALAVLAIPAAFYLPGPDGVSAVEAMQAGSNFRFSLVSAVMCIVGICGVALLLGLVRRAGPFSSPSWPARAAGAHALAILAGAALLVACLLTWHFGMIMRL